MTISIGTNMLETGPPWRLARLHLARLAEVGAHAVDLHMGARYEVVPGLRTPRSTRRFIDFHDPRHWDAIEQWMAELGLEPVCSHSSVMGGAVDLSSPDDEIRGYAVTELEATVEFCAHVGAPIMVVHPGANVAGDESREQRWAYLRQSIASLLPALERSGLRIGLENLLPGALSSDLHELVAFVADVAHPLIGVCLDTGHLHITSRLRPAEAVNIVTARLFALHIHDNHGTSDEHQLPFAGSSDWTGFARALQEVGYAGTLNLEVVDRASSGGMASAAFIHQALEAGQKLLQP